jgi:hypothetical protein
MFPECAHNVPWISPKYSLNAPLVKVFHHILGESLPHDLFRLPEACFDS